MKITQNKLEQQTVLPAFSLYIHVPFCTSKCDYCDFYSVPIGSSGAWDRQNQKQLDAYIERILAGAKELVKCYQPECVPTVSIGGGTPSILGAIRIKKLLAGLHSLLPLPHASSAEAPGAGKFPREITVEVNPESADKDFLLACRDGGVSRISMGVQSLYKPSRAAVHRNGDLSSADIEEKLALVSDIYPGAFSVDLISGLPLQTETVLRNDIDRVCEFNPGHISLYALTLDKGSASEQKILGRVRDLKTALPDADQADSLWISGSRRLMQAGYEQYEVSNFSQKGKQCLHNIRYWRMESWLGLGPGASGTVIDDDAGTARRHTIAPDIKRWFSNPGACVHEEFLDADILMKETLLMGFRFIQGPDPGLFSRRFGIDIGEAIPQTLKQWRNKGCMAENGIALNRKGLLLLDRFLVDAFGELDEA